MSLTPWGQISEGLFPGRRSVVPGRLSLVFPSFALFLFRSLFPSLSHTSFICFLPYNPNSVHRPFCNDSSSRFPRFTSLHVVPFVWMRFPTPVYKHMISLDFRFTPTLIFGTYHGPFSPLLSFYAFYNKNADHGPDMNG